MKQSLKKILPTLVVAIVALVAVSLFRVGGGQIEGVADISLSDRVSVTKYDFLETDKRTEYLLAPEQVMQLRALILQSSFSKSSSDHLVSDMDTYDIQVEFTDTNEVLIITCYGSEYISVVGQFDGKHLQIDNPNWKTELETILSNAQIIENTP